MSHFFKTLSLVFITFQIILLLKCSFAAGFSLWSSSEPETSSNYEYGECEFNNQNNGAGSYYPEQYPKRQQSDDGYYTGAVPSSYPRRPGASGVRSASAQAGYYYRQKRSAFNGGRAAGYQFQQDQTGYGTWNQDDLVASHNTLPIGSYARITNENNGLSVVVRIVDRGPNTVGRISSLSRAAFKQIGDLSNGIIPCYVSLA